MRFALYFLLSSTFVLAQTSTAGDKELILGQACESDSQCQTGICDVDGLGNKVCLTGGNQPSGFVCRVDRQCFSNMCDYTNERPETRTCVGDDTGSEGGGGGGVNGPVGGGGGGVNGPVGGGGGGVTGPAFSAARTGISSSAVPGSSTPTTRSVAPVGGADNVSAAPSSSAVVPSGGSNAQSGGGLSPAASVTPQGAASHLVAPSGWLLAGLLALVV